jgi:chemosensory pili system protein ChpC
MLEHIAGQRSSLTGLLLPLGDRALVLPNVAVAELIGQRAIACEPASPAGTWAGSTGASNACR